MAEVGCAGMRKFWFLATFACLREFRYTRKKSCGGQVEAHTFFLVLLTILLVSRILGELAARLKTPPVIGELLAGVLLGPSLLGWVEPTTVLRLLAEIGIILLLFEVGLETDILRLIRTGVKSVIVAAAGIVLP